MINKTEYHSWKLNNFAEGCRQCVLGRKLVVFVTGICPKNCFYCPLSDEKKNQDAIYVNERRLNNEDDIDAIIEESRLSKAWGAGFTGGDPLSRIDRTCRYIKLLKREFGQKFHIHLYTILESLTEERLNKLDDSGLDELRLHPDIFDDDHWSKMALLGDNNKRKYSFKIGVEIPSIPGYEKQTEDMIDFFIDNIDFLNINELEISDTNSCELVERDFHTKDRTSYGVMGSQEMALRLLSRVQSKFPRANVHYCTCKLKDAVQLRQRLILRAQNTRKKFDILTEDGNFIRGVIYLNDLKPGFGYIKTMSALKNKEKYLSRLEKILNQIKDKYYIPDDMIELDTLKPRIITNIGIVKQLSKTLKAQGLIPAIVEQYPSYDQMEVDVEFL